MTNVTRTDVLLFTETEQRMVSMLDLQNGTLLARWRVSGSWSVIGHANCAAAKMCSSTTDG